MSANYTPEKEDLKILTPFKMQVLTNFPYIEADFDALTNYQLLCKVVEYLNNVITETNEVTEQTLSLYNAYVALQNYVNQEIGDFETTVTNRVDGLETYMNNYFTNLDVQQEINNKLDQMVTDGTLQQILEAYAQPILQQITSDAEQAIRDANTNLMERYRFNYYNDFKNVSYPITMDSFFKNKIYKTAPYGQVAVNFKIEDYKNSSTTTWYISPNGNSTNDGLSEDHPKKNLTQIISSGSFTSGDTIIFLDGIYDVNNLDTTIEITTNINLIAKNKGKAYIICGEKYAFTQNGTYSNIYQKDLTYVYYPLCVKDINNVTALNKVNSLETLATTPYAYYYDNTTLYINYDGMDPSSDFYICRNWSRQTLKFTGGITVYIEGLKFYGGGTAAKSALDFRGSSGSYNNIYIKDTIVEFSRYNGMEFIYCNAIIDSCQSNRNCRDGFNYAFGNFLEYNCIAGFNGHKDNVNNDDTEAPVHNGSTAHQYSQVIRLNGIYFGSYGSNVADVQTECKTLNYNCVAFDSTAGTTNLYNSDFSVQQAGAVQYLYNCKSGGSKSYYSLGATTNGYIYYDVDVTFNNTNNVNVNPIS